MYNRGAAVTPLGGDAPTQSWLQLAVNFTAQVQGYLAHKKHPPAGPYSSPMPRAYGDHMEVSVSYVRGTPVSPEFRVSGFGFRVSVLELSVWGPGGVVWGSTIDHALEH